MKVPPTRDPKLAALLAKAAPMTEEERRRQIISLAYGNAKLADPRVKRWMVEAAAERIERAERRKRN